MRIKQNGSVSPLYVKPQQNEPDGLKNGLTAKIIINFAKDSISTDGDSVGHIPLKWCHFCTGPTPINRHYWILFELIFQFLTFVVCGISLVNSFLVQLRQTSIRKCPLIDWWLRLYKLKSHLFMLCQWASVLTSCLMLDSGFRPDDFIFKLSIFNFKFRPFGSELWNIFKKLILNWKLVIEYLLLRHCNFKWIEFLF